MKKKLIITCLTLLLAMYTAVEASTVDKMQYAIDSNTLLVSGIADKNTTTSLQAVTLRIFKPGVTAENFKEMTDSEKKNAIVFVKQTEADQTGKFVFTYSPKSIECGNYKVCVTYPKGDTYSKYVLFMNVSQGEKLLEDIKFATTKEKMLTSFAEHSYLFKGTPIFDEISAAYPECDYKDSIAGMITGKTFSSVNDVMNELLKSAVVTAINNAKETTEFIDILDKYKNELGFANNKIYSELFMGIKNDVSKIFLNKEYKAADRFNTDFCDTIILTKINNIKNHEEVSSILKAEPSYLKGFNFTDYDKLTDTQKTTLHQALTAGYSSIDKLKIDFNNAVKKVLEGEGTQSDVENNSSGSGNQAGISKVTEPDKKEDEKAEIFNDLSGVEWAKKSILKLYEKGIVSGIDDKQFLPSGLITREQYAKMIVIACGFYDKNSSCNFNDVVADAWYYSFVASAANNEIVFGMSTDSFGTGSNITREDMAVMAYRAAKKAGNIPKTVFEDDSTFGDESEIADYAKEAIHILKHYNIMSGKGENLFEPKAYATRAEAATMIYGLICLGGEV